MGRTPGIIYSHTLNEANEEYVHLVNEERAASEKCDELIVELVAAMQPIINWGGDNPGDGVVHRLIGQICKEYGEWVPYIQESYRKDRIPDDLRAQVYARDGHKCLHCESVDNLSIDHIHPESKGGLTVFENLQTLCRSCNSRKGAKVCT